MLILHEEENRIIEEKRQEMIRLALDHGFTSHLAVKASQELDVILHEATKKYHHQILIFKNTMLKINLGEYTFKILLLNFISCNCLKPLLCLVFATSMLCGDD